jgi:hypothetical protein
MTSDAPYQLDLEKGRDPRRCVVTENYHHHDGSDAISSDGHRTRTTKKQPRRPGPRRKRKQNEQHDRSVPTEHSLRPPHTATTSPLIVHESRKVGDFGGGCCLGCSLACLLVLGCCVVLPAVLVLVGYLYLRRQMDNTDYSSQAWQDYWNGSADNWKDNYQMDDATISNYIHQYAGEGDDDNILAQYSQYFWQWWEGSNGDDHNDVAGD